MAKIQPPEDGKRQTKPATTPEDREDELVSLAFDLAEEQIRGRIASSQVVTHFLKLGSSRERVEQERLRGEVKLAQAKIEAMESAAKMDELYAAAIKAMSMYQGNEPDPEDNLDDQD